MSQPKTLKTTFSNMISRGIVQSDRIVIEDCGIGRSWAKRNIWNRVNREHQQIKEVWIRKADGTLELLYKKEAD